MCKEVIDRLAPGSGSLTNHMQDLFKRWQEARKPAENVMLDCYADYMRIPRDDDHQGTGQAKSTKAKNIFVGSTRNKIRSAAAKILDSLFGNGDKLPFDTTPSKNELVQWSDALEKIVRRQLEDGGFSKALHKGVYSLAIYGTAFIAGPFVRTKKISNTNKGVGGTLQSAPHEYPEPYFEFIRTLDVYPDPDAKCVQRGDGIFFVSYLSPHSSEVTEWESDPAYRNIAEVKRLDLARKAEGSNQADDLRAMYSRYFSEGGTAQVAKYFGRVPAALLQEWEREGADPVDDPGMDGLKDEAGEPSEHEEMEPAGEETGEHMAPAKAPANGGGCGCDKNPKPEVSAPEGEDEDPDGMAEAFVVMIGGIVVRAERSPYSRRPINRAIYEAGDDEFWGVGIAENNMPVQKIINAAFRLYLEGKGRALHPVIAVKRKLFKGHEDFKLRTGKVFELEDTASPEEIKAGFQVHLIPDVTDGWEKVVEIAERFSDDDTGISKYTTGNDSKSLNQTATGISMIMNAGSLPLKGVLLHIDSQWVEPCIQDLIKWNLEFLDPATVAAMHDKDTAGRWMAIQMHWKDQGSLDYVQWKATGAKTLMAKEVLMNKLQGFLNIVAGNQQLAQFVDLRELVEQIWAAGDTGLTSPVYTDEDIERMTAEAMDQAQKMQAMQQGQALAPEPQPVMEQGGGIGPA